MSTAAIFGLMIGSIGSKFATNWGRRRSILVSNLVIVIATAPSFFSSNFWMLLMSRFIMGIPAAVLVNASSLYQ
jgi:predicted MFS family arabinose efflux permease